MIDASALVIDDTQAGAAFGVRVRAGAKKTATLGVLGGRLKIAVQAPPERGKANEAVRQLLAGLFGVRLADVVILQGETSPDKRVQVRGLNASAVQKRLIAL